MPKHIFWPTIDCFSMYATGVTRIQGVVSRRIGGRDHFRSRDKDGGYTIRSDIAENPLLYANFTTLSFIEPELLPIEVLQCGNRNFSIFSRKIVENIKFSIRTAKLTQMMPKHIFWLITDCSSFYATGITRIQSVVLRRIGGRDHFRSRDKDGGHTIRSAIAEPPAICKLHDFIFYRTGVITDRSFTLRE